MNNKFENWKSVFDNFLNEMIIELKSDYLDQLGLTVKIDSNYHFNGGKSRWLAAYERQSRQIESGIILIAINYPHMFNEMCKRNIEDDDFNIEAQAKITIGHEIGHGLFDYINHTLKISLSDLENMPRVALIKKANRKREEAIVEEFGENQFPEATGTWTSILSDALEELGNYRILSEK